MAKNNRITEKAGLNALRSLVESKGSIFREITNDDIGFDTFIEFCEKNGENYEPTGILVAVQVKSGISYFNPNPSIPVGTHREYWKEFILPAIGIVYDPDSCILYWENITEYLTNKKNRKCTSIPVPDTNILNGNTFDAFRETCSKYCLKDKNRIAFYDRLESLYSEIPDISIIGLKNLFLFERNNKVFWNSIINYIYCCKNKKLLEGIVYYLAIGIGEQYDVWWNKDNMIDKDITTWLKTKFNQIVDVNILYKILSVIDEYSGLERGSIGGFIVPFVKGINNRKELMFNTLNNSNNSVFIRDIALSFYLNELDKEEGLNFINEALSSISTKPLFNVENNTFKELEEELLLYKQVLLEHGRIDLV